MSARDLTSGPIAKRALREGTNAMRKCTSGSDEYACCGRVLARYEVRRGKGGGRLVSLPVSAWCGMEGRGAYKGGRDASLGGWDLKRDRLACF